ncbi:MAG TPA: hypothetical protein DCM64_06185, partial [Gammaproteobacteria bacterium]|nr:hypothetical protein [Gammaproteobacteria bacterium]
QAISMSVPRNAAVIRARIISISSILFESLPQNQLRVGTAWCGITLRSNLGADETNNLNLR